MSKKPIKVDLATVTLIFVLLIALIVILCCLISKFYNKMQIAKDNVATLNDKIEIISNEEEPVIVETLNIDSEEVTDLFNVVKVHNFSTEIVNFHRETPITSKDLDNKVKLLTIFNECFVRNLAVENPDINGWGDIYKTDIETVKNEIFGKDVTIDYDNIENTGLEFTYDDEEEKYISEINEETGGVLPNVNDVYEIVYAEKIGKKIYVYNRYARVCGRANVKADKPGIYATSDKKIVIDEGLSRTELNSRLSKYSSEGTKYLLDEEMFSLRANYRDDILTFRHEFELNDDSKTYKWVSSAPIL